MEIIKELRNLKGISQKDLADEIGSGLRMIQRYESGDNDVPIKNLKKIASFFDVSTSYLLNKEELINDVDANKKISEVSDKFEKISLEEIAIYVVNYE